MLIPALLPHAEPATCKRLGDAHREIFEAKYLRQVRPFDDARKLLVRVAASGRKIVIASSASASELDHYVGLLDIGDLIAATTTADDVQSTKPAPDIFVTALAKVAPLLPNEVLVVGDTPYDLQAAARGKMKTIALRSGKFTDESLRRAGAAWIYDSVATLLADFDNSPLNG
jgi:membrane protein